MKNGIKGFLLLTALLITVLSFTACGKEWKVERNTVRIQKEKPVTQAMFFGGDAEKSLKTELFALLKDKVQEYNAAYGKDLVVITKPKEGKGAEGLDYVVLEYATMKEFGRFHDYSAFDGELSLAEEYGFDLDKSYFQVENGKVDTSRPLALNDLEREGCRLLIIDPAIQPFQPDKEAVTQEDLNYFELVDASVLYVTDNIRPVDSTEFTIESENSDLGYIIYK